MCVCVRVCVRESTSSFFLSLVYFIISYFLPFFLSFLLFSLSLSLSLCIKLSHSLYLYPCVSFFLSFFLFYFFFFFFPHSPLPLFLSSLLLWHLSGKLAIYYYYYYYYYFDQTSICLYPRDTGIFYSISKKNFHKFLARVLHKIFLLRFVSVSLTVKGCPSYNSYTHSR